MRHKFKKKPYISILCLAMIISLSAVGVGFAAWHEGLDIRGVVSTGEMEPVFGSWVIAGESCSPSRADVWVEGEGKRLAVWVQDAYPGYYLHLRYAVTNLGTIPVQYETEISDSSPGLEVQMSAPQGVIDIGESQEGELWLVASGVEEEREYDFTLLLGFRQWNMLD